MSTLLGIMLLAGPLWFIFFVIAAGDNDLDSHHVLPATFICTVLTAIMAAGVLVLLGHI
jgi:hypothetical protein